MAVRTASSANKEAMLAGFAKKARLRDLTLNRLDGAAFFERTINVETTDIDTIGDELRLIEFPDNSRWITGSFNWSDMDTNGTPALVVDLNLENGTNKYPLVNNTTKPQAGGAREPDQNLHYWGLDLTGYYLTQEVVTAAATAAAGTIEVRGLIYLTDPRTSW